MEMANRAEKQGTQFPDEDQIAVGATVKKHLKKAVEGKNARHRDADKSFKEVLEIRYRTKSEVNYLAPENLNEVWFTHLARWVPKRVLQDVRKCGLSAQLQDMLRNMPFPEHFAFDSYYQVKNQVLDLARLYWKGMRITLLNSPVLTKLEILRHFQPPPSQCDTYRVSMKELESVLLIGTQAEMNILLLDSLKANDDPCVMINLTDTLARQLILSSPLLATYTRPLGVGPRDVYSVSKEELQRVMRKAGEENIQILLIDTFGTNKRRSIQVVLPHDSACQLKKFGIQTSELSQNIISISG